jgi:PPOX class probable FMN-dependent enzyme
MHPDPEFRIENAAQLREHYQPAMQRALDKQLDHLDSHCKSFINEAPFLCIATSSPDGFADCSPKGDAPGFVDVLDDRTIVIPDRRGNNRLDTLTNLLANPQIGLIFLIPGVDETLRINGRAEISVDPDLLQNYEVKGKLPTAMIVVHVEEAYLHCPKALIRSNLWARARDFDRKSFPTLTKMISDQLGENLEGKALKEAEADYEKRIEETLY